MDITHLSLSNTVPVCKYCTIGSHKTLFHGPLLSHFGLHFGHPKNASAARWTSPVPWTPGKLSQRQERLNAAQKRLNPFKSVRQVPEVRRFQRSWGGSGGRSSRLDPGVVHCAEVEDSYHLGFCGDPVIWMFPNWVNSLLEGDSCSWHVQDIV